MGRIGLVVAGMGLAAALTACGGSDDAEGFADGSADDIVKTAKTDMGELETMRISGSLTSDGEKAEIDLRLSKGGDCAGSVSVGGTTAEVRSVDDESWVRTDDTGGKWVALGAEDLPFGDLCDIDTFLDTIDPEKDEISKAGDGAVDGEDVVLLTMVGSDKGATSEVSVLADAPHRIVRIEVTDGDEPGSVTISDFDEAFEVEAPPDDEIAAPDSLG